MKEDTEAQESCLPGQKLATRAPFQQATPAPGLTPRLPSPRGHRSQLSLVSRLLLLLLLSCSGHSDSATPQMAAHQAPPSVGFSRQEHWSGLPLCSPSLDAGVLGFLAQRFPIIPLSQISIQGTWKYVTSLFFLTILK